MRIQHSATSTFVGVTVVMISMSLFYLFSSLVPFVDAFSSQRILGSSCSSASLCSHRTTRKIKHGSSSSPSSSSPSSSMLFLQDPDPSTQEKSSLEEQQDDELSVSVSEKEEEESSTVVKDTIRKVGKKVSKGFFYAFGFFMNIIGLYFSFGILLNIFGFAYDFSWRGGYKIDTIENKRIERQFEQESRRYEKERYKTPSQLAVDAVVEAEASAPVAAAALMTTE